MRPNIPRFVVAVLSVFTARCEAGLIAQDSASNYSPNTSLPWVTGSNGGSGFNSDGWTLYQESGSDSIADSLKLGTAFRIASNNYAGAFRFFPGATFVNGKGLQQGQTFSIDMDLSGSNGGTNGSGLTIQGQSGAYFRFKAPSTSKDYMFTGLQGDVDTGVLKTNAITMAFTYTNQSTSAYRLDVTPYGGKTVTFNDFTGTAFDSLADFQLDGYPGISYFDNLLIYSGGVVPEPTAIAVISVMALGLLLRRRRRDLFLPLKA